MVQISPGLVFVCFLVKKRYIYSGYSRNISTDIDAGSNLKEMKTHMDLYFFCVQVCSFTELRFGTKFSGEVLNH